MNEFGTSQNGKQKAPREGKFHQILFMEEKPAPQLILVGRPSFSQNLQYRVFDIPRWCRIFSINSILGMSDVVFYFWRTCAVQFVRNEWNNMMLMSLSNFLWIEHCHVQVFVAHVWGCFFEIVTQARYYRPSLVEDLKLLFKWFRSSVISEQSKRWSLSWVKWTRYHDLGHKCLMVGGGSWPLVLKKGHSPLTLTTCFVRGTL